MSNQDQPQDPGLPPQPRAVLRGHKAQVHAAAFIRSNQRLLTGDADGFVVAWDLAIMRPRVVWQPHMSVILGIAGWAPDKIITHGRDNKLIVWRLTLEDESVLRSNLPMDVATEPRPKPWMLHLLEVNTMNFCSFASCPTAPFTVPTELATQAASSEKTPVPGKELLLAVPNTLASEAVDIHHLPSQTRIHTVRLGQENGMAMALALVWLRDVLALVIGYENGLVVVAQLDPRGDGSWATIYRNKSHGQPILSLDVAPNREYFLTTGADATIAKHPLLPQAPLVPALAQDASETFPPDVGPKDMPSGGGEDAESGTEKRQPSSALAAALSSQESTGRRGPLDTPEIKSQPIKVIDTKHSGQQGVRIRSDGRVFATAGWDSKTRVYSTKSMREVAVLKWHAVGCFTVAFADLTAHDSGDDVNTHSEPTDEDVPSTETVAPRLLKMTVKERRVKQATNAHWLATGSKDGKVSLWDVF
ncbi:WD repeat protein [Diaporthe helianthi]|uniref:ASTRA-associated protein 1 n=1 Tax=Diaporthe helianthi TaxID=158607 RepID=A0A2P5I301_DIAHE|nr:WD repeat protein [Diaporthe helianthi]